MKRSGPVRDNSPWYRVAKDVVNQVLTVESIHRADVVAATLAGVKGESNPLSPIVAKLLKGVVFEQDEPRLEQERITLSALPATEKQLSR